MASIAGTLLTQKMENKLTTQPGKINNLKIYKLGVSHSKFYEHKS